MTIGARVLKTGMAVALAIFLSDVFGFMSPLIAAVAAIVTIQPSIYRSWQRMADQVQTNLLGALIALAAVRLFGQTPIAVGLVCIVVILISIRLKMESTISLTLVTVVAIMEAHGQGWVAAAERFTMVLTGIGASFVVNVFVFPPRPKRQFTEQVREAYKQLSLLLRNAITKEMKEHVYDQEKGKLREILHKLEDRYEVFEEERKLLAKTKASHARQLLISQQMIKALQKGTDLLDVIEEHYFASPSAEVWKMPLDRYAEDLSHYHEYILLKSEDKMKPHVFAEPMEESEEKLIDDLARLMQEDMEEHKRMLFVASGIFEYAYHLRRLDKLLDQVKKHDEHSNCHPLEDSGEAVKE